MPLIDDLNVVRQGIHHAPNSSLHILSPVLSAWHGLLQRYAEVWGWRDVPYWYNERATLSTLAAAVWASGGIALEEYRTDRGEDGEGVRKGRGDLYLSVGGEHFIAEAKQHWSYPTRSAERIAGDPTNLLRRACADARAKRANGCPGCPDVLQRRLGVVFAVPCLPPKARGAMEAHVEAWLVQMLVVPADCASWFLVPPGQEGVGNDCWLYPGVCLLLREVRANIEP